MYDPMIAQKMAQIDQEYAQKKAALMQGAYNMNGWGGGQAVQQPQAPKQNVDWVYVANIDGAKDQIVQPETKTWMMDNNNPYIYVKSVDKFGSPEFHAFFIQEVPEEQARQQQRRVEKPQIDPSQYVQRSEFDELKARLDQLTNTQRKQPAKADKGAGDNG